MKQSVKAVAKKILLPTPRHLREQQIQIDDLSGVEASLRANYFTGWRSDEHLSSEKFAAGLHDHLIGRLESDRRLVVPWIDAARSLRGQRILEIGCGTGSSTVAFAEQGAKVTGIDIDEDALVVARDRADAYGIDAEFHALNADQLASKFGQEAFDSIVFFASLEHMLLHERLAALRDAWAMLPVGGFLALAETPNRLWWFDNHTAYIPFFHWLPDELAFDQSRHSSRELFREMYREWTPESSEHFLRRGRGMSFHEIDAAIRPIGEVEVVSSLSSFWGPRYKYRQPLRDRRYRALLRKMHGGLHQGFFDDVLYLILRKS